jgi:hypothetical protein
VGHKGERGAAPTLLDIEQRERAERRVAIEDVPAVKAALGGFPGAVLDDELVQWSAEK